MSKEDMSGDQRELFDLAHKIRAYQEETRNADGSRVSDGQMCGRFAGLGSTRQYTRILSGDMGEVNVGANLASYRAMWNLIEMMQNSEAEDDPLYDDLSFVVDLRKACADAMREKGLTRYVHMQAPQGSGKTTAAAMLKARYGARVVLAEANEIWKENMGAALSGLLIALGVKNPPVAMSAKFERLVERLNETRVCLVIDEAHHLGPKTLNLIKSLINQTPGEFVLLAMGTLWNKLETSAYAEAWQLTKNRMLERIRMDGVEAGDIASVLGRWLGMSSADAAATAKPLANQAYSNGNMAFVKLVCRKARRLAGKAGTVTPEIVAKAAALVAGSR